MPSSRCGRFAVRTAQVAILTLAAWSSARAQASAPHPESVSPESSFAFVGAHVLAMDQEAVLLDQTVVVHGDRIVEIGPAQDVVPPASATIVEAHGRYLLPGLWDSHMHLTQEVGAREDFGDAPLYLAFGVTSVMNLMGDSTILDLKRRIAAGEILAPNLYTSGRQLNEPTINTASEAVEEVRRQRKAGYDLIKFHEVYESGKGYVTTTGVDDPTLAALNDEARRLDMPLLGHVPDRQGLPGVLRSRMSMAHASQLLGAHFWPKETEVFRRHVWLSIAGMGILALSLLLFGADRVVSIIRRLDPEAAMLAALGAVTMLALPLAARPYVQGFAWLGAEGPIWALTVAGLVVVGIALALLRDGFVSIRARRPRMRILQAAIGAIGALILTISIVSYWLPVLHRSTPAGLGAVARAIKASGISVVSSLSVEDTLVTQSIPELRFLEARTTSSWERWKNGWTPERIEMVRKGTPFFESVVGALHREGVPILLGTDAMGFPLVVPGVSVHREMRQLLESGMSPYQVLRSATFEPAVFLGIETEVGTVDVGKRADLLLVDGNPLQSLDVLRSPAGVMLRGRWLKREELMERLELLSTE